MVAPFGLLLDLPLRDLQPYRLHYVPLHCVQSWYYFSMLPKMVKVRMSKQKKLKDALDP